MTKHCRAVLSFKEVATLSRLPTPGYHSDNRSKLPHCPSPLCVLWGKGQVPGSSPPPHTLPRLEPWKRAMRDRGAFTFSFREITGPELITSAR